MTAGPRSPSTAAASGWGSSPTRLSASAARRARSRASSGTTSPPTARTSARDARSTTRGRCRRAAGGTCTSSRSSRRRPGDARAPLGGGHMPWIPASTATGPTRWRSLPARRCPSRMDRWLFMSDVCKHCTNAGCLDACPTGALIRTEFETVIVQPDICNGCGYCVTACPFGVIDRDPYDGRAAKCTLCYDRLAGRARARLREGLPDGLDPVRPVGGARRARRAARGRAARARPGRRVPVRRRRRARDQLAGNLGAFFLLTDPPERYGLPAQADSPTQENVPPATAAGLAAAVAAAPPRRVVVHPPQARGEPRPRPPARGSDPPARGRGAWAAATSPPPSGAAASLGAGGAPSRAPASRCSAAGRATRAGPTSTTRTRATPRGSGDGAIAAAARRARRRAGPRSASRARSSRPPRVDLGGARCILVRRHRHGRVLRRAGVRRGGRSPVGRRRPQGVDRRRWPRARRCSSSTSGAPSGSCNMLRIFKPRSAMSMGAWCLRRLLELVGGAVAADLLGRPRDRAGARRRRGRHRHLPRLVHRSPARVHGRARCGREQRLFLPPIFVCTATATGAAATRSCWRRRGPPRGHPTRAALGRSRRSPWAASSSCRRVNERGSASVAERSSTDAGAALHARQRGVPRAAWHSGCCGGAPARGWTTSPAGCSCSRARVPVRLGGGRPPVGARPRSRRHCGARASVS